MLFQILISMNFKIVDVFKKKVNNTQMHAVFRVTSSLSPISDQYLITGSLHAYWVDGHIKAICS